ncbi:hypothetical protein DAEQUDRAFT_266947 [Daedalea quercina L-15889]|uniref:Lipoprotein n=1 Tax=Daedalea quercina L-15889 TaxID=1314783 RepID=A0A165QGX2_9APHY|nr:hypothetical protein DAEQUDRAFT_266947 [Daedalea quercina L-15889]
MHKLRWRCLLAAFLAIEGCVAASVYTTPFTRVFSMSAFGVFGFPFKLARAYKMQVVNTANNCKIC